MKNRYPLFLSQKINPLRDIKFYKQILSGLIIIIHVQISCKENIIEDTNNIIGAIPGEWIYYGFEDKTAYKIVIDGNVLYTCAGKDGLWKRDISNKNSTWQYLGLTDTSLLYPPLHAVTDVDVYEDTLIVAMYWLNEREEYQDVGIWKSTDAGISWFRSDIGIARIVWPYSSMWSVKRSLFNPYIVLSSVGTTFKSIDSGNYWYQVDPSDTLGRGESFVVHVYWHPQIENEVWVYGQGNLFGPILARSKDWGENWDDIHLDINEETPIYKIAFDGLKKNNVPCMQSWYTSFRFIR